MTRVRAFIGFQDRLDLFQLQTHAVKELDMWVTRTCYILLHADQCCIMLPLHILWNTKGGCPLRPAFCKALRRTAL